MLMEHEENTGKCATATQLASLATSVGNKLTPSIIQTTKVCVLSMKELEIFYT